MSKQKDGNAIAKNMISNNTAQNKIEEKNQDIIRKNKK